MQAVVAFIIIAMALAVFSYFGQLPKQEELPQSEETFSQTQEGYLPPKTQTFLKSAEPTPEPTETKPTISINTYITSGPKEGEVINETTKITFEFEAKVSPEETKGRVTFETKIEGFDEDWKKTSYKKRTVTFPSGSKEYTFLVRAKINDVIDPTPAERNFKINTSPYFGKVKIYRVKSQTSSQPSSIILRAYLEGEEINITGWRIKGNKGEIIIPQGIETYLPGGVSPSEDIFIKQSDRVYLWSSSNPMGINKNFRLNKCLGYLAKKYDFSPSLSVSKKCPSIKLEEISYLDGYCQEFILRNLKKCEVPDYSQDLKILFDFRCRDFIDSYTERNLNYQGCFLNYSKDEDFLDNYWYIYSGRDIVSKLHDGLYLYDKEGLVVDKYLY